MRKIKVRTSERSTLKRCPQQWSWAYVEGLASPRPKTPLWFGTAIHVALAEWYRKGLKRGPHPAETATKVIQDSRSMIVEDEEGEKTYVDSLALAEAMCNGYVEEYGKDPSWEILFTEGSFRVPMRSMHPDRYRIDYRGTFDGAFRDLSDGSIWLLEHKTAAGLAVEHLPLDEQNGAYTAMAEIMLKREGLMRKGDIFEGVMYNFLRKAMADDRLVNPDGLRTNKPQKTHYVSALDPDCDVERRKVLMKLSLEHLSGLAEEAGIEVFGEVSARQPQPRYLRWPTFRSAEERVTQLNRIRLEAHYMERMRAGDENFPIIKHPNRDCSWQCQFFTMCQLDEQGDQHEVENYKRTMFIHRDPYEDNNKSAEDFERDG